MKMRVRKSLWLCSWLFATTLAYAHEDDKFVYQADTSTLTALQDGSKFQSFVSEKMAMTVRTERPLAVANPSTSAIQGLFLGSYSTPRGKTDLVIHLAVTGRRIETELSLADVKAAILTWQDHSPIVSGLKDLKPQGKRLVFDSEQGFHWEGILEKKFTYTLLLDATYDVATKKIQDRTLQLSQLKKFIGQAESDTRGRLILENNTSGLPAFVTISDDAIGSTYTIHHPLHDIEFVPATKEWTYRYAGPLKVFGKLSEIRRAQENAEVRTFIAVSPVPVRVSAAGGQKTFFSCVFSGDEGKILRVKVEGKVVTTLSK